MGKKNDEFSFSAKLTHKLVCLTNTVVLDHVFSFKSLNTVITNCDFEFDSIVIVLNNDILFLNFFNYRCFGQ